MHCIMYHTQCHTFNYNIMSLDNDDSITTIHDDDDDHNVCTSFHMVACFLYTLIDRTVPKDEKKDLLSMRSSHANINNSNNNTSNVLFKTQHSPTTVPYYRNLTVKLLYCFK